MQTRWRPALAGNAVRPRAALPARASGMVLRRDAVGHAFCPRAGQCTGRQGMSTRYGPFPDVTVSAHFLAARR